MREIVYPACTAYVGSAPSEADVPRTTGRKHTQRGLRVATCIGATVISLLAGWAAMCLSPQWMAIIVAASGMLAIGVVFRCFTRLLELCVLSDLFVRLMIHIGWSYNDPYGHPGLPVTVSIIALLTLHCRVLLSRRRTKANGCSWLDGLIGILVSVAAASIMWASYSAPAIHGLILLLQGVMAFFYFGRNVQRSDDIAFVVGAICSLMTLASVVAIAQYLTGSSLGLTALGAGEPWHEEVGRALVVRRVSGLGGTPNELARSLVTWLPLGVICAFTQSTKRWIRVIALCSVATGTTALCLTASRGGLITAGLTALAGALVYSVSRSLRTRLGFHWKPATFVVLVLLCVITMGARDFISRLVTPDDGSTASRVLMLRVAGSMVADNPIIGVGLNNYLLVMSRYDDGDITETFFYPVHNLYMLVAGELGCVGLGLYIVIFGAFVFYATTAFGSMRPEQAAFGFGVFLALIAFAVEGFVEGDTLGSRAFMHFWVAGGCAAALHHAASQVRGPCKGRGDSAHRDERGVTLSTTSRHDHVGVILA